MIYKIFVKHTSLFILGVCFFMYLMVHALVYLIFKASPAKQTVYSIFCRPFTLNLKQKLKKVKAKQKNVVK